MIVTYTIDIYSDDQTTVEQIKETQTAAYLAEEITFGSLEVLEMGYGTDGSEMIIELPVLTSTLVNLVKLAASEAEYISYGGDE